jgi:hypothetical protein
MAIRARKLVRPVSDLVHLRRMTFGTDEAFFSWVSEDGKSGFDCFLDDMTHPAGRLH